MVKYHNDIKDNIIHAVSESISDFNRIGVLFSGGLDSSLIAHLVKVHAENAQITLYTVGTNDSQDILNSESAAKLLDMKFEKILINSQDIASAIGELSTIIGTSHPVKISYELPLYLGLARINEECVFSGQGADELFGGYARYLNMNEYELETALKSDVEALINDEIKMDHKVAEHFKKSLKIPYLHEEVVKTAQNIPIYYKIHNGERKIILKETAIELGLPSDLANKQKKAAQYSSGIIKELKRMAKMQKISVNELIEHLL
jgi:asparagine synthase (glutamine-hydrolysing)